MEQAQPRRISVKKFDDDIVVTRKEGQTEDEQIEQLVSIHGAGGVFVDGVSVADMQAAAAVEEPAVDPVDVDPVVVEAETTAEGDVVVEAETATVGTEAAPGGVE